MRCIVTAGPTYEPLDEVRRLTNLSTGKLGTGLANFLAAHGHEVTLLVSEQSSYAGKAEAQQVETFTTTDDLREHLQTLASDSVGAVFHSAAVSDFAFGKVWLRSPKGELKEVKSPKISSGQTGLLAELIPTPKIISGLRDWFPQARLIGWKYEVEGTQANAIHAAEKQIALYLTDGCVANGPAYGEGYGLLQPWKNCLHLDDSESLFDALERILRD